MFGRWCAGHNRIKHDRPALRNLLVVVSSAVRLHAKLRSRRSDAICDSVSIIYLVQVRVEGVVASAVDAALYDLASSAVMFDNNRPSFPLLAVVEPALLP